MYLVPTLNPLIFLFYFKRNCLLILRLFSIDYIIIIIKLKYLKNRNTF